MKTLISRFSKGLPAAFLALALLPGFGSAHAQTKVKLVLDWAWQAQHAIWTLAQDNGHFAKEGLDVTIDRGFGSGDTIAKVAAKTYEFGFADGTILIKFNAEQPADQLTAALIILDASPNAVIFLKSSGIKTPKDLEGKSASTTKNDGTNVMFPAFARLTGIDPDKLKWQHVEPRLRDTLVIRGQADVTLGWATTAVMNMMAAGVERDKIGYLLFHDYGMQIFSSGVLVRKDYAAANPEVVKGFVRATIKGMQDMVANPKVAIASLMKRDKLLNFDIEMLRYELIRDVGLLTPHVAKSGVSTVDRARYERAAALVAEAFNLKAKPTMEDTYTDRFLPPQSERMLKR
ncbi:MAG: ABC transporter substrate-binding protein [Betaproteobacteria bacterium]|nr:ABC transporter substrate-binding protein [Betaproteobacteria bacterium]